MTQLAPRPNRRRGRAQPRRHALWPLTTAVVTSYCVVTGGCTEVELIPAPASITVAGQYCTDDAHNFEVPVRIVLIIDTSASMEINDPADNRAQATGDLIDYLMPRVDDIAFALIGFNTAANALTNGFERDPTILQQAVTGLEEEEGFTNYLAALDLAQTIIHADLAEVSERLRELTEAGEDTRYERPWYFVVFLSDGIPRMPTAIAQSSEAILWEVEELMDVPDEALGITLHTAFLGAADDIQRPEAEALLKKLAREGGGSYTSFEKGDEIDFRIFEFEIKRLFDTKLFVAFNPFAPLGAAFPLADSDADGLTDLDEVEYGTDLTNPDSDGDGMRDGFEVRTALDPLRSDPHCDAVADLDSDSDGLLDCEESFLNLCPERFDCDGDLFPDNLEFWSGSNPGDASDILFDHDFDGVLTREELLRHTNPRLDDVELHARYGYHYETVRHFDDDLGVTCYDFEVSNINLLPTEETQVGAKGINTVQLYVIESPRDDAEQLFILNRAVIELNRWDFNRHNTDVYFDATDYEFEPVATQEAAVE